MTLTKRAIAYARRYPGKSATEIANALHARPSSVSSILYRACQSGLLTRKEGEPIGQWTRQSGPGPLGGATYYPAGPAPVGKPAFERVSGEDLC